MNGPERRRGLGILALALALCACAGPQVKPESAADRTIAVGERLEAAGDYDGALVQYVQALQEPDLGPAALEAHYRVGRVHAALGNVATAREAFQRVLAGNPQHAGALEGLGLLQLAGGDRAGATKLLEQAVMLDSGRWRARNGLGVLADLEGDHAKAQGYFTEVLVQRPGDYAARNNLGYSYFLGGELDAAQREFERSIAQDPKGEKGWSNLALVQARRGQYAEAVQSLERIMNPPDARYSVGYLCLIDGKLSPARDLLEESIRMSDRYEPAAQAALKRVKDEQARSTRKGRAAR